MCTRPLRNCYWGLAGWFVGFDGDFEFESIGDSYSKNNVPYVGIRALPAFLGAITVPLVYAIMVESGYPTLICCLSALLLLLGTPHSSAANLVQC